ncbi:uncharacterized protein with ParB-like and HNH nuclease domain [Bacillus sp. V-88]|nr:hypothetical protein B1B00_19935 [Bacillus sp. DSM 27956]PRX67240.1 uncharacterized protein with ParB-like and HNH nuclease domain [Bacillus sp. V-88]SLK24813.1 Uncharacterized conserved protein, contains ParB-like and HNH nuclease domains [Bacillus sp. V-88]
MSYEEKSIEEIIKMIGKNEIYLPAIQRKFVWKYEQIERLFDSIMRGYPIGTFLFWFINGEKKNEYTFYKFLQNYHERDNSINEIAPKPELKDEIIGILDGQQRLSSMYIALQGSYAYKKPYARWDNDNAFPKRNLYLNLLKDVESKEEDYLYEFKFLTEKEAAKISEKGLWFHIKDVLSWGEDPEIDDYYDGIIDKPSLSSDLLDSIKSKKSLIKKTLRKLHQRIVLEKLINYFKIEEQELDEILDIFVRVNSGGTVLSKSDLLFSTIVAHWEQGREEIETFLATINNKGDGFYLDNDFVMRSCLVLTDCPVLFKVNSFKKENIDKIKREWNGIKKAILKTVELLVEFGFTGDNLTSQNALIPISYFIIKGGNLNKSKNELRKYLIHSLLKQIYGGQGDQVLSNIRDELREKQRSKYVLKSSVFTLDSLFNAKLSGNKSLEISKNDIEDILEYKKGPYTFMVLSLLYPNLKLSQINFHQDHIHPASLFTQAKMKKYLIPQGKWEEWMALKDKLPNLQLMEGKENESKNKTPFKEWLNGSSSRGTNVPDKVKFKNDNYIPNDLSLEFKEFDSFYEGRKNILREKLKTVLL